MSGRVTMANSVSLKWKNKDAFFRRLVSVVPAAEQELAAANETSANAMATLARSLAPVNTGRLLASIRIEPRERGAFAVMAGGPLTTHPVRQGASQKYDYALGAEFGTQDTPAQPFFWPSFRVNKRPAKARATRALTKAIKQKGFRTNG